MLIALKINWSGPGHRPPGMLRDVFWLSAGQAIELTNASTNPQTRIDVKEIVAVDDGLIIKYKPASDQSAQIFRTKIRERILANAQARDIVSIDPKHVLDEAKRSGSAVH